MALTKEDLQAIAELTRVVVKEELAAVKSDVAKIDKIVPKIDGLYESVVGTGEKFNRLDLLEKKVEDHDHRIFAVEEKLKRA